MTAVNYEGWEIILAVQLQKAEYVSVCLAHLGTCPSYMRAFMTGAPKLELSRFCYRVRGKGEVAHVQVRSLWCQELHFSIPTPDGTLCDSTTDDYSWNQLVG
jgi:hypothetical protein